LKIIILKVIYKEYKHNFFIFLLLILNSNKGGIAEAVSSALLSNSNGENFHFKKLNVNKIPMSGQPNELLERFEIDAKAIQKAVESF